MATRNAFSRLAKVWRSVQISRASRTKIFTTGVKSVCTVLKVRIYWRRNTRISSILITLKFLKLIYKIFRVNKIRSYGLLQECCRYSFFRKSRFLTLELLFFGKLVYFSDSQNVIASSKSARYGASNPWSVIRFKLDGGCERKIQAKIIKSHDVCNKVSKWKNWLWKSSYRNNKWHLF